MSLAQHQQQNNNSQGSAYYVAHCEHITLAQVYARATPYLHNLFHTTSR